MTYSGLTANKLALAAEPTIWACQVVQTNVVLSAVASSSFLVEVFVFLHSHKMTFLVLYEHNLPTVTRFHTGVRNITNQHWWR